MDSYRAMSPVPSVEACSDIILIDHVVGMSWARDASRFSRELYGIG